METPLRILLLEDDDNDAELIRRALSKQKLSCELRQVKNRAEFLAALWKDPLDLILSDYTLPDFDGQSALRWARQRNVECPFIFVSGTIGEERAVESLKLGASDYVLKDRPERLGPVIIRALKEAEERAKRLRSEQKLSAAETQFRALVETALVGIYIIQNGKFAYVNPKMSELLGYRPEELTCRPLLDFVAETDQDKVEENIRRRFEDGVESIHYELRLKRNDGGIIEVEVLGSRIQFKEQPAIIGTLVDITERNWMENVLSESVSEFRATFDWAPLGMAESDLATGRFLRVNRKLCEITGHSAPDLLRMSFHDITHPNDCAANFSVFQRMLAGENTEATDKMRFVCKDGAIRFVSVAASIIRDSAGSPLRTISIIQDLPQNEAPAPSS